MTLSESLWSDDSEAFFMYLISDCSHPDLQNLLLLVFWKLIISYLNMSSVLGLTSSHLCSPVINQTQWAFTQSSLPLRRQKCWFRGLGEGISPGMFTHFGRPVLFVSELVGDNWKSSFCSETQTFRARLGFDEFDKRKKSYQVKSSRTLFLTSRWNRPKYKCKFLSVPCRKCRV